MDDFEIQSAAMVPHARADVRIVLNPDSVHQPDGVFVSPPRRYDFYATPAVHTLTPSSGPTSAATLEGAKWEDDPWRYRSDVI